MPDELKKLLMAKAQKPFSEEEQKLRDLWNKPVFGPEVYKTSEGWLPIPEVPTQMPTIIGQKLVQPFMDALKIAPNLTGKVNEISFGPNRAAIDLAQQSNLDPQNIEDTTLLGQFSKWPSEGNPKKNIARKIYVNPRTATPFAGAPTDEVLAHELTHSAGHDEAVAKAAEPIWAQVMRSRKNKK